MEPVNLVSGRAVPFGAANVDTDVIIPSRYLKLLTREGLGKGCFAAIRDDPDNIFDKPENHRAPILIAGANFGCGSSREHAAWALLDMGFRAIIAPGFADIFSSNSYKNGLLLVALPPEAVDRLMTVAQGGDPVHIDLEHQTVSTRFQDRFHFEMDSFRKHCLLNGLDEISLTHQMQPQITAHEERLAAERPWIGKAADRAARMAAAGAPAQ